ncbi:hypothetical protein Agub_g15006, partial [Astrephomene gubernaculifera]
EEEQQQEDVEGGAAGGGAGEGGGWAPGKPKWSPLMKLLLPDPEEGWIRAAQARAPPAARAAAGAAAAPAAAAPAAAGADPAVAAEGPDAGPAADSHADAATTTTTTADRAPAPAFPAARPTAASAACVAYFAARRQRLADRRRGAAANASASVPASAPASAPAPGIQQDFLATQEAPQQQQQQQQRKRRYCSRRGRRLGLDRLGVAVVRPRRPEGLPYGVWSMVRAGEAAAAAEAETAEEETVAVAAEAREEAAGERMEVDEVVARDREGAQEGLQEEPTTEMDEGQQQQQREKQAQPQRCRTTQPQQPPPELSYASRVVQQAVRQRLEAAPYPVLLPELSQATVDASRNPLIFKSNYRCDVQEQRDSMNDNATSSVMRRTLAYRRKSTLKRLRGVVKAEVAAVRRKAEDGAAEGAAATEEAAEAPPSLWELEYQELALMALEVGRLAAANNAEKGGDGDLQQQAAAPEADPPGLALRCLGHVVPVTSAAAAREGTVVTLPTSGQIVEKRMRA